MRTLTTIRIDEADRDAIAQVRARYGVATDSDAIRLALRLVARAERIAFESEAPGGPGDSAKRDERDEREERED